MSPAAWMEKAKLLFYWNEDTSIRQNIFHLAYIATLSKKSWLNENQPALFSVSLSSNTAADLPMKYKSVYIS